MAAAVYPPLHTSAAATLAALAALREEAPGVPYFPQRPGTTTDLWMLQALGLPIKIVTRRVCFNGRSRRIVGAYLTGYVHA